VVKQEVVTPRPSQKATEGGLEQAKGTRNGPYFKRLRGAKKWHGQSRSKAARKNACVVKRKLKRQVDRLQESFEQKTRTKLLGKKAVKALRVLIGGERSTNHDGQPGLEGTRGISCRTRRTQPVDQVGKTTVACPEASPPITASRKKKKKEKKKKKKKKKRKKKKIPPKALVGEGGFSKEPCLCQEVEK